MVNALTNESLARLSGVLIQQLKEQKYADSTIETYQCNFRKLEEFMLSSGIEAYTTQAGELFLNSQCCNETRRKRSAFQTFISRLDDCFFGMPYCVYHCNKPSLKTPSQFLLIEEHYISWCKEKGNAPATIKAKNAAFARFTCRAVDFGCCIINELEPAHVTKEVLAESNQEYYGYYREILRFIAANGYIDYDYSTLVPKCHRVFQIPTTYTKEERSSLENAPDKATPLGKRDYAIILLANRLGLRSGDIANLTFDKIDFESNTITVNVLRGLH